VKIPDRVNARWIATLADAQLISAESQLHSEFFRQETAEKKRCRSGYVMLEGPEPLVSAWLRWSLVNNETRTRGLVITRRR
jgi:hypothetical protein